MISSPRAAILAVENLSCRRPGEPFIDGISFEVAPGELLAIVGPNGSGKTMLCQCLALVIPADAGTISMDGTPLLGEPWRATRAGLAVVPKGHRVFPELSVRDNLLTALLVRSGRSGVDAALEEVFTLFPILRERADQPAGTMSGGEQQMVAIARALLSSARLLVLDEPSIGLSPRVTEDVYEALHVIAARGIGVVVMEESPTRAARHAARLLTMRQGRFVAERKDGETRLAAADRSAVPVP